MAQDKKEYLVIEPRSPRLLQEELNKHAGYEVVSVLPLRNRFYCRAE